MTSRDENFLQIITLRRGIQNKVITAVQSIFSSDAANISQERTLQASRENEKFKTVEDVDGHIRQVYSIPLSIFPKNILLEILRCGCGLVS
jgi:hypothetical protein